MTPEGEAIIRYTLRNDSGAEVQLTNYGAAIVSVKMPDREAAWPTWCWDTNTPKATSSTEPPREERVGRCANRIAFGQMTVEGQGVPAGGQQA